MPYSDATIDIDATPEEVFDLIHNYARRLDWDPFLREARLLQGVSVADAGVNSRCSARWWVGGMTMETIYVSFNRPRVAAVKMTRGPLIFRSFAASIRQVRLDEKTTRVTYRYNFELRPCGVSFFIGPIVRWIIDRETRGRLVALKRYLENESVD